MVRPGVRKAIIRSALCSQWADRILQWQAEGRDVFVYFDNAQKAAAPRDAERLIEQLRSAQHVAPGAGANGGLMEFRAASGNRLTPQWLSQTQSAGAGWRALCETDDTLNGHVEEETMAKRRRKYSRGAGREVEKEMRRYKRGTARSGRGGKAGKVKNRRQAIAIGLSIARKKGKKVPPRKRA